MWWISKMTFWVSRKRLKNMEKHFSGVVLNYQKFLLWIIQQLLQNMQLTWSTGNDWNTIKRERDWSTLLIFLNLEFLCSLERSFATPLNNQEILSTKSKNLPKSRLNFRGVRIMKIASSQKKLKVEFISWAYKYPPCRTYKRKICTSGPECHQLRGVTTSN